MLTGSNTQFDKPHWQRKTSNMEMIYGLNWVSIHRFKLTFWHFFLRTMKLDSKFKNKCMKIRKRQSFEILEVNFVSLPTRPIRCINWGTCSSNEQTKFMFKGRKIFLKSMIQTLSAEFCTLSVWFLCVTIMVVLDAFNTSIINFDDFLWCTNENKTFWSCLQQTNVN